MWDERYRSEAYAYGTEPNDFLKSNYTVIPKGKVLCLADGEGRNSVFLAKQGYDVTAVDLSIEGIRKAERLARANNVDVNYIQADLAEYDFGSQVWQGVVSIFCHLPPVVRRRVNHCIPESLAPGGVYLLEGYRPEQLEYKTGGPPSVELLITAKSIEQELSALKTTWLKALERDVVEGQYHTGRAAVVQFIGEKSAP